MSTESKIEPSAITRSAELLDKLRSNLAVTRYRIMEAQLTLR